MPLAFIQGRLVYFAHVPRCGGTAVENYLHARFGRLAFVDRQFNSLSAKQRWSKTSPQHLETQALERIMPRSWISWSFTVVRHPAARIASVFRFQRDIEQSIPTGQSFSDWVCNLAASLKKQPHQFDNHTRPASDLVPSDAVVFRLEDGLSRVVGWLDQIEGATRGPREVAAANVLTAVRAHLGRVPGPEPEMTLTAQAAIAALYADDFKRFGYTTEGLAGPGIDGVRAS